MHRTDQRLSCRGNLFSNRGEFCILLVALVGLCYQVFNDLDNKK